MILLFNPKGHKRGCVIWLYIQDAGRGACDTHTHTEKGWHGDAHDDNVVLALCLWSGEQAAYVSQGLRRDPRAQGQPLQQHGRSESLGRDIKLLHLTWHFTHVWSSNCNMCGQHIIITLIPLLRRVCSYLAPSEVLVYLVLSVSLLLVSLHHLESAIPYLSHRQFAQSWTHSPCARLLPWLLPLAVCSKCVRADCV